MKRWDGLLSDYLSELSTRGLAPETVRHRGRELERFGNWLKRRQPRPKLESVGADQITAYMKDRATFKARSTVAGIISDLRNMGEYLVRREVWSSNPLRWMRGPKLHWHRRPPRRIGREQMRTLWRTAATARSGYHRHLWVTLLSLLYGTGLRRGELARLDVGSWDESSGTLLIDGRKTGRQRQVVLPSLTQQCMSVYLPQRRNHLEKLGCTEQPALWIDQHGGRLSPSGISGGIRRLAARGELGRIHPHQFRHSCASDLLEEGIRLPEIQRLLGHESITTTVRYLQVADPQRHEAAAVHPINDMLSKSGGE